MQITNRKPLISLFLSGIIMLFSACEKNWDNYYQGPPQSDIKLWDAIKGIEAYSTFISYLEETGFDTVLQQPESFTLFIPTNSAFSGLNLSEEEIDKMIGYHIAKTIFIPSNINGSRKLETFTEKFALLSEKDAGIFLDGIPISLNNELYKDGIYYEMEQVAFPPPNLYEYVKELNPILSNYIDQRDSVALDYSQSKPIRINDDGEIEYDSVFVITNLFERDFFPVSVESRENEATMIIVSEENYNRALDIMADNLKGTFVDHEDIPLDWQTEFLIPSIFESGIFDRSLEYSAFQTDSLFTIQGELIPIDFTDYDAESQKICSNGLVYEYADFKIPEELYLEEIIYEGEDFVIDDGGGFFTWNEDLVNTSDETVSPGVLENATASQGKYLSINLPGGSTSLYSLEFTLPKIFPGSYKLTWRGYYRPSGIVDIYVNGEKVGEFDNYNFRYPVNGNNPINNFNKVEFDVDNITTYSDIVVKMEYREPGIGSILNGINVDYISLKPAE